MATVNLNISWPIAACKCGAGRTPEHKPRGLFIVCPQRRWWNFWQHDNEQLSLNPDDERYLRIWNLA